MELSDDYYCCIESKAECTICLKSSLQTDVWKCCFCDINAHFICMVIDKLITPDKNRLWTTTLTLYRNYNKILDGNDLKGYLVKNLKKFANNKAFQHLKRYGDNEKFEKTYIDSFVNNEMIEINNDLKDLITIKDKLGDNKLKSSLYFTIFCPDHYVPVCCYEEKEDESVGCDYCGKRIYIYRIIFYLLI